MKLLKATGLTCIILLFFSLLLTIMFSLYLSYCISDVVNKDCFVKMVVKIDSKESGGGRSQGVKSYCIINGKKLGVRDMEHETMIDKYYYVWYNTKTDKVYLTDKNSLYYDAYGQLVHALKLEFAVIGISLLLFFIIRFIGRRIE